MKKLLVSFLAVAFVAVFTLGCGEEPKKTTTPPPKATNTPPADKDKKP